MQNRPFPNYSDNLNKIVKKNIFGFIVAIIAVIVSLLILEKIARLTESKSVIYSTCGWRQNPILGWDNRPGFCVSVTPEYKSYWHINSYGMNDDDIDISKKTKIKIMVVGDSHTIGVGVSSNESYPNVLEQMLFKRNLEDGTVYNCAVSGYNLGQYLLRIRQLEGILRPDIIIVGFTMANDLYDFVPPRLGGFVYGSDFGRIYFDLDENGNLIEKHDLVGADLTQHILKIEDKKIKTLIHKVKVFLQNNSALYRRYKRSELASWIAVNLFKIESLWPGSSTAVKKNLDQDDLYRWALAEELLKEIAAESKEKNRQVIVVNIPYLPQVYDKVWKASFGQQPRMYDRFIGGVRLSEICLRAGIHFVDTTQRFVEEANQHKRELHYKFNAHPNPEGHKLIALGVRDYILKNNLLNPSKKTRISTQRNKRLIEFFDE